MFEDRVYLTEEEAAKFLGLAVKTVQNYVSSGKLTPHRAMIPTTTMLLRSELEELKRVRPVARKAGRRRARA